MSLLNDMLKDLNKNKQGFKTSPLSALIHKRPFLQFIPDTYLWLVMPFVSGALLVSIIYIHDSIMSRPTANSTPKTMAQTFPLLAATPLSTSMLPSIPPSKKTPITAQTVLMHSEAPLLVSELPVIAFNQFKREDLRDNVDLSAASDEEISIHKVFSALTDTEWHDEQLNLALSAIQEGNDEPAEQILNRILTKLPKAIVARETLATLYLAQERFDDARQILNEGLRFAPNAITLNTIKARLAFEQNNPKDALAILKQFRPGIRKNPDFYGLMAAILQSLGQEKEAGNLYKLLVEIEPSNGQYWLGYGLALEYNKANQQAITAYKTATEHYDIEPAVRAYAENRLKTLQG